MNNSFTSEEALALANKRILLPGLKPEDYYVVDSDSQIPIQIAKLIAVEYTHIMGMVRKFGSIAIVKYKYELVK